MSAQHDPLRTKVQDLAQKLNRRRRTASETSEKIIQERNAFFDRLALLNAGALTFSVTLFASLSAKNPRGLFFLQSAWIGLLIALAACLVRNLSHQHYRFSRVAASLARTEVDYIDVDHEAISSRVVAYSDSSEPFDQQREVTINRANRAKWQQQLTEMETAAERHFTLARICEWIAAVSMTTAFLFLVMFAMVNTHAQPDEPPLQVERLSRSESVADGIAQSCGLKDRNSEAKGGRG
jgi:uncharacterized integral membrane protein